MLKASVSFYFAGQELLSDKPCHESCHLRVQHDMVAAFVPLVAEHQHCPVVVGDKATIFAQVHQALGVGEVDVLEVQTPGLWLPSLMGQPFPPSSFYNKCCTLKILPILALLP